jgi:NADH dehydrogenase [ubiquinone] 1 alpha subcomplex assembly factor 7
VARALKTGPGRVMLTKPTPSLADTLRRRIVSEGPITVHDYMEACLADPVSGYYIARQPVGKAGDFITAPEISQIFGELLGLWVASVWQAMGEPETITIAELGPGRGTLMADALRAIKAVPRLHQSLSIALIETSPVLREVQADALGSFDVAWFDAIEDLPDVPVILLANEFLDALPVRQYVRREDGWHERCVGTTHDAFAYVERDEATDIALPPELRHAEAGATFETRPAMAKLVAALAARTEPVAALFVDYGHARSGFGDTLQAVRGHRFADPLEAPGNSDLSAHVDFADLARQAKAAGLKSFGPISQSALLIGLGLETRRDALLQRANSEQRQAIVAGVNRLTDPGVMGDLFKALAVTSKTLPPPPPFLQAS